MTHSDINRLTAVYKIANFTKNQWNDMKFNNINNNDKTNLLSSVQAWNDTRNNTNIHVFANEQTIKTIANEQTIKTRV